MRALVVLLFTVLALGVAQADLSRYQFKDAAEEARFKALIAELRCLVCQNQSLADSDASLAEDLRREVFNLMREGSDDAAVMQYLVDRYGDFVLYRPPLKPSTYLLWFGPVLLFALALWWGIRNVRRQREEAAPTLDERERARLAQLLGDGERE